MKVFFKFMVCADIENQFMAFDAVIEFTVDGKQIDDIHEVKPTLT